MTAAAGWHRQKTGLWKVESHLEMEHFKIPPEVVWVERFPIGGPPEIIKSEKDKQYQLDRLNRALRYGIICGREHVIITIKNQLEEFTSNYVVYHVGFKYRPDGK